MDVSRLAPVERLLRLLALEQIDRDLFLGEPGPGEGRLFGGLVAAQSVVAAARTVRERALHSLHAYFLRPGRHDVPLRFAVDEIRDGRTFTTRRVVAQQAGEAIFSLAASFARPEDGISHQDPAPDAPAPEGFEEWEIARARLEGGEPPRPSPIELRVVDADDPERPQPPRRRAWLRPRTPLPDDPTVHAAALVYASDRVLLGTVARPHRLPRSVRMAASLDHALWIHRAPVRFDDWLLYAMESPVAHQARGLALGGLYARDGTRVATVAQEGLIRAPRGL